MEYKKTELLAPAGNPACLHAAVRAGADAVYLGADSFNARRGAQNFTLDDLSGACDYAHLRGVKIYLTVNTVVLPGEVDAALELVRQAYRRGVDAFIIQDIGLAAEVHRSLPEAEIHISTQMNTHSEDGIDAARELGARRVTLARELAFTEIDNLCTYAHNAGMEIEVFAHGALCICYSGQCFASSMVGGRSANRGMCAQACRLPYELHNRAVRKPLEAPGEHLLSPKDLSTLDVIYELVVCGVDSLKIEGRMKSPEYVYAVTHAYRSVLDRVLAWVETAAEQDEPPSSVRPTEEESKAVAEAFSRGFTQAYLRGKTGNEMMSYGRPNNRGVPVGRVSSVKDGMVVLECTEEIMAGDVCEFWTNKGHFAQTVSSFEPAGKNRIKLEVSKPVGKGDRVFRVRSASAAYVDDESQPRVPVSAKVRACVGEPLSMELSAADGTTVTVGGNMVEPARTKPLSREDVYSHIDRFGSTPFVLSNMEIELAGEPGMGFSALHHIRAQAAEELAEAMLSAYRMRTLPRVAKRIKPDAARTRGCQVFVLATNPTCARAAKRAGADFVVVPTLNYKRGEALVAGQISQTVDQAGYPNKTIPLLPTVGHDDIPGAREHDKGFDPWRYVKPEKPVIADNLGQIERALSMGAVVDAGPHVPVLNSLAADELARKGVSRVWLSPELTLGQIQSIGEESSVALGITLIGSQELMVCEHCLLMSQGPCDRKCAACVRRRSPHYLKDRKGYEMPVITDCCGRSHLYNAVQLDIAHTAPDLIACGVSAFMVDTTLMNTEETTAAVSRAVRARDLAVKSGNMVGKSQGTTTGHLFRSIS